MNVYTPQKFTDYELLDSGNFEKLERFGKYIVRRTEPQALWQKSLSEQQWKNSAHAVFHKSKTGNEEAGQWEIIKPIPAEWKINYALPSSKNITFSLALTGHKHVGVFPEQAANWDFIYKNVAQVADFSVLNLFAYTGGATLAAAQAGAKVTHLDSVKNVINWAKGNAELCGITSVRWIVEDALQFVQREVRRNKKYNAIILDPPAYGRGTNGERWLLEKSLLEMLLCCKQLLVPKDGFLLLNLYSLGFSAIIAKTLIETVFPHRSSLDYGELVVTDSFGKQLSLSTFSRVTFKANAEL